MKRRGKQESLCRRAFRVRYVSGTTLGLLVRLPKSLISGGITRDLLTSPGDNERRPLREKKNAPASTVKHAPTFQLQTVP